MKPYQSIRWHLQWCYGLLLAVTIATLCVSFYFYEKKIRLARLDTDLNATVGHLIPRLIPPRPRGGPFGPPPRRRDGPSDEFRPRRPPPPSFDPTQIDPAFYWIAWRRDGADIVRQSGNLPVSVEFPADTQHSADTILRSRGDLREAYHITPAGAAVLVGTSRKKIAEAMQPMLLSVTAGGALLFVTIMTTASWFTGRSLRPIQTIGSTAERIIHGDYSGRIDAVHVRNELGQLAAILNESFERLDEARKQQLRFTADASHELRTPLAVIIADGEFALRRDRDAAHYRKSIRNSVDAALHMRDIIEALLEISRFDTSQKPLEMEPVRLDLLAADCAQLLAPLAKDAGIEIRTILAAAPASGNPQRIRQTIINLVGNGIHHNTSPGWVEIETGTLEENGRAFLRVRDSGSGIAPEDLPHVFNRFYRSDASRSDTHHSGLGLAITRAIVSAHGGTIHATSPPGEGACFTIELPARSAAT